MTYNEMGTKFNYKSVNDKWMNNKISIAGTARENSDILGRFYRKRSEYVDANAGGGEHNHNHQRIEI